MILDLRQVPTSLPCLLRCSNQHPQAHKQSGEGHRKRSTLDRSYEMPRAVILPLSRIQSRLCGLAARGDEGSGKSRKEAVDPTGRGIRQGQGSRSQLTICRIVDQRAGVGVGPNLPSSPLQGRRGIRAPSQTREPTCIFPVNYMLPSISLSYIVPNYIT